MRYGKLIDGGLMYAPSTLQVGGYVHYHPSAELYASLGWLPVVDTPYPEIPEDADTTPYYASHWEAQGGQIVKVWTETTAPEPEPVEPSLEDRVGTLEGETSELYAALDMILGGVTEDEASTEEENTDL